MFLTEYSGIANITGVKGGYQASNPNAPLTNRQFTSEISYTGGAESKDPAPMSYEGIYNATMNEEREGTLKSRAPTASNVTLTSGSESINMEIREKPISSTRITQNRDKIANTIPSVEVVRQTVDKDTLNNNTIWNRNNNDLLTAFNKNPYTQSLNSY
jgi:hypothetical protein